MPNHGPRFANARRPGSAIPLLVSCLLGLVGCKAGDPACNAQFAAIPNAEAIPAVQASRSPVQLVRFDEEPSDDDDISDDVDPTGDVDASANDETTYAEFLKTASQQTTPNAIPQRLESLIETALATHPSIAAAHRRVAAAALRIPQVKALPDPMLGNTFWPIHDQALQTAGGRVGHQFALSQNVPWPAKLDAKSCVAAREVQIAQAEIGKVQREVVESVRLAYYELWLADELIRIVEDKKELVIDLITISEARYKTGGSQQDILRAELEGDKLEDQLIALRQQKEQARADLGTLVRQPVQFMPIALDPLDVSEVAPQLDQLIASAEHCNPTLQGLAAEISRDRANESLACTQKYPDLQLGLGYSIIADDTNVISPVANGHDNINFTVGVTLPIWRDKINAGIHEAAHTRTSTMNRREAERDKLQGQLRRQVAAADAAIERLDLFRERLIPRTEKTLRITTADYQGKKADFTDLIDIYQELLAYQVQVARTTATLASTLARIERTVGCRINESFEF